MSYSVNHLGSGHDVDGRHEQLVDMEKNRQTSHLQKVALEATKPFVDAVTKHARHGDTHQVNVHTSGHFNDDGTGSCTLQVHIGLTPPPVAPEPEQAEQTEPVGV